MIDCLLATDAPYRCLVCGFSRPQPFRRNCPKAPENIAARRRALEQQLADFHGRCTVPGVNVRPLSDALALIDQCAGCDDFRGDGCAKLAGCQQRAKWMATYGLPTGYLPKLVGLSVPCEKWRQLANSPVSSTTISE